MTDEQIECLVERIVQRLRPPVLVMVTAAAGYRHAIRQRLADCGESLHLALDGGIEDEEQWQAIGKTLSAADWQHRLPSAPYKALLLPFLDYPLAADLVNGSLHSPLARRVHDALLSGLPVLALRYHCDPASELNQLQGAQPNSAYAGHMQATLVRLVECGITLCTMNELLACVASGSDVTAPLAGTARRYLTVTDIVNNPALAWAPEAQLTDAAIDFLKNRKKNLTLTRKPGA
ncbi:MAG: hypothetical protein E6X49_00380 [Leclercia adecarboxylata]|nr:hypothetical protein [uncultured Leclercia sp.]MDU4839594.1 hypothetical protein [Leclercia adecarboxylata]